MTIAEKAAAARERMEKRNPGNIPGTPIEERKRIPMSVPVQKLWAPEIPGYHTHWMLGTAERLQQAHNAGYTFVDEEEVDTNEVRLGGDIKGHTDMGSRVSKVAGGGDMTGGQPTRLYLMKQKLDWYEEDQKLLHQRNDSIVDALTANFKAGMVGGPADGERSEDVANRYVDPRRAKIPEFFRRKTRK
jgi:hypothetical protein